MKPLAQNTLIQNRYLIVHLIGKGGMGEVYLAVDQRLGSAVALKRTFFAGDEMLGNAFEREARTLARMRHPVLPKVSDHFGENDEQYLVMEHISGDDLSKRLTAAGKAFPLSWVLFWADQLLDALSYLHTHEPPIIHRDIKPQNLKLTDENHIILLDFGLSKTSTGQTNISQSGSTGSVVGYTPHYAPMEQIRGIGTSARSDIYSLSATLYQLMTNTVPVDALSRADAMLNGMPDPIKPPGELNPEVPKIVSEVILRGMEVSQDKRFANARDMQRVLRKAFNEIQAATTANTVVFSAVDAEGTGAEMPSGSNGSVQDNFVSGSNEGAEAPAIAPDASIDLDATMAYGSSPADSAPKQSDVRTEVLVGENSNPRSPSESPVGAPTVAMTADEFNGVVPDSQESAADLTAGDPTPDKIFDPNATVPFISVDEQYSSAPEAETNFADLTPGVFASSASDAVAFPADPGSFGHGEDGNDQPQGVDRSYLSGATPESEVVATESASAAQAQPADRPAKSSTGKVVAIFGAIAAIFLLVIAVGGGIWAYMNFGPGASGAAPSPEPTADESLSSPSPEPTIESAINADTQNSNMDDSATSNSNSNDLIAEPSPGRDTEPKPDTRPNTRPTPRVVSTPRSTPVPKPTQKPVTRPTVLP